MEQAPHFELTEVGPGTSERGVRERRFEVACQGRRVPGLVFTPEAAAAPRPLALLGHGGTLHKGSDYIRLLARRLVRHHGISAAAIDGPVHGERSPVDPEDTEAIQSAFRAAWARPETTDQMVADWRATLAALDALDGPGDLPFGPVGYWGLSMGTIFGLPFVAAEPRIEVAVLGMMGVFGPTAERLRADAATLRCPLLFLVQWDDELIPREAGLALFDAMGSRDRRLHAHPGRHTDVPAEEFRGSEEFLARHLAKAGAGARGGAGSGGGERAGAAGPAPGAARV